MLKFNLLDFLLEISRDMMTGSKFLTEMVKSLKVSFKNKHFGFYAEPDEGRLAIGEEYFKVFADENKRNGIKFNRICFRKPIYIIHNKNTSELKWYLDNKERELMDMYLRRKRYDKGNYTAFQCLIIDYNKEMFGMTEEQSVSNVGNPLPFPNALPFDLQQPNYNNLK